MTEFDLLFIFNNVLLGIGLAMDAFSVSIANALNEPKMHKRKFFLIAGVFGLFQGIMPMTGWICIHTIAEKFESFQKFIPWIALILLCFIGIKMLIEGIKNKSEEVDAKKLTLTGLLIQAIATSIDALSVGFTIANYNWLLALIASLIIAVITFVICLIGLIIGKKFGSKLSGKASVVGGIILIAIGIEIFIKGII